MSAYEQAAKKLLRRKGVERSTMMNSPCLRVDGEFFSMMFEKENCLIVKVSPERVDDLIAQGIGREFNLTRKRFKEWVLIPQDHSQNYEGLMSEALEYVRK
ncbi:MAG: hypothetical protein OEZ47_05335 [Gammaproteobacteria bacterium]|nr:hypothetical protein [Gammaproteobacteria bacterium]